MTTIYWAGDSTAKQNGMSTWPQTGIAQEFERFLVPHEVRVENHAENGRSTKSFIDEGRLALIYDRITKGDFLFVQFGHNDEKPEDPTRYADPDSGFPDNLEKFVNAARNKGATPVIITPVTRFNRDQPGALYKHDRWAESARCTGERLGVAVVDLTAMSEQLVDAVGEDAAKLFYMNLPAHVYPHYPHGQKDNTHLQPAGAVAFGALIAKGLYELGGEYRALLRDDFGQFLHESAHMGMDTTAAEEVEK